MKLSVGSTGLGRGVFAMEPILAFERIIEFTGPLLRQSETTPETYAVQIGPDLYLGASGGPDDFINHSCEPNSGLIIRGQQVHLHAIRGIRAGEEICFDYSTTMDEEDWEMTCHCGTAMCRRFVRDGRHLPDEIWNRYLKLGILPDYVQKSRSAKGRDGDCRK